MDDETETESVRDKSVKSAGADVVSGTTCRAPPQSQAGGANLLHALVV